MGALPGNRLREEGDKGIRFEAGPGSVAGIGPPSNPALQEGAGRFPSGVSLHSDLRRRGCALHQGADAIY
jgi:hypothetical protein